MGRSVSGLVRTLPPLHELARNAGVELPEYLGERRERAGADTSSSKDEPFPELDAPDEE